LDVRVTDRILGRTVALGVLVVHRTAERVFPAHGAFARVGPLLDGLFAHAPFAGVARASWRAKTLETAGNVFAPAVLSAGIRSALVCRAWNVRRIPVLEQSRQKILDHSLPHKPNPVPD